MLPFLNKAFIFKPFPYKLLPAKILQDLIHCLLVLLRGSRDKRDFCRLQRQTEDPVSLF